MRALALTLVLAATAAVAQDVSSEEGEPQEGFTPDEQQAHETLRLTGYVDVGFVRAEGNGSSFAPHDTRTPLDYGVDPFAPAVNSRGEVASIDSTGRFTNGFLPRSAGVGSTPSFLLNTVSADLRVQPASWPVFVFVRAQVMPRLLPTGDQTRFELQQAFGRLSPLKNAEFALSLGRFDSVFGIEYLENEANLRLGITPSLTARYTTGHGLGLKAFYRVQLPALWSAVSLNLAATNNGARIEALVPVDASLVGVPVGTGRLGYELNLQHVQAKVGLSGLYGARNDQRAPQALQKAFGVDLRVNVAGLSLAGEFVRLRDDSSPVAGKATGVRLAELASGFDVWGGWGRLGWTLPWRGAVLTGASLAVRYDRREAQFEHATWVRTDRFTASVRLDFFDLVALKAEYLINRELTGAPNVDNNVFTSSAVFTW